MLAPSIVAVLLSFCVLGLFSSSPTPTGDTDFSNVLKLEQMFLDLKSYLDKKEQNDAVVLTKVLSTLSETTADVSSIKIKLDILFSPPTPNVNNQVVSSLRNHVLQLEQTVADLQSKSEVQAQKDAAVLSSVLFKLSETTTELTTVKTELTAVKDNYTSLQNELDKVKVRTGTNEGHITTLSQEINSTTENLTSVEADMKDLKSDISKVKSATAGIKDLTTALNITQSRLEDVSSNVDLVFSKQGQINMQVTSVNATVKQLTESMSSFSPKHVTFQVEAIGNGQYRIGQPIVFKAVKYDSDKDYSVTSGTFTVPVSGVYLFWLQFIPHHGARSSYSIQIQSDGGPISSAVITDVPDPLTTIAVAHVGKGQRVWIQSPQYDLPVSDLSVFGGVLIQEDK